MVKGQPCPNDGRELINMDILLLFTRLMEGGLQVPPLFIYCFDDCRHKNCRHYLGTGGFLLNNLDIPLQQLIHLVYSFCVFIV